MSSHRLRAWLRPPRRIWPTKAGWFALAAPLFLGVAAINASNNLLFVLLGATLGVITLSGVLSERAVRGVEAEVALLGEARAGEDARLLVTLRRPSAAGPAFALHVRERAKRGEPRLDAAFPVVEGLVGRAVARRAFERRGRVELRAFEVATSYPFAFVVKSRDITARAAVVVRPRRVPVPGALSTPFGSAEGGERALERGRGEDIYGLRERTERDAEQRVHALRSLALDREVVVETEAMRRPVAWLGVASSTKADPVALERAIEVAAATLAEWDALGYAVGLATSERSFAPGTSVDELLDALAVLEPGAGAPRAEAMWLVPTGVEPPEGDWVRVRADGAVELPEAAR